MDNLKMVPNESPAAKMIMVYEDGSTKEVEKGFMIAVSDIQPGDTEQTVSMLGCHISGKEMIDLSIGILAPIVQAAYPDAAYAGDDDDDF